MDFGGAGAGAGTTGAGAGAFGSSLGPLASTAAFFAPFAAFAGIGSKVFGAGPFAEDKIPTYKNLDRMVSKIEESGDTPWFLKGTEYNPESGAMIPSNAVPLEELRAYTDALNQGGKVEGSQGAKEAAVRTVATYGPTPMFTPEGEWVDPMSWGALW